jgi:hypothetical protein
LVRLRCFRPEAACFPLSEIRRDGHRFFPVFTGAGVLPQISVDGTKVIQRVDVFRTLFNKGTGFPNGAFDISRFEQTAAKFKARIPVRAVLVLPQGAA